MMRAALWAGLLGAFVNAAAQVAFTLGRGDRLEPAVIGMAAVLFPVCFVHGLVVASLLRDLNDRGAPRWQLAAVGLPVGALLFVAVPLAAIWGLLGSRAIGELLAFRDPAGNGFVVQCLATGAASALGALMGLNRKEPS